MFAVEVHLSFRRPELRQPKPEEKSDDEAGVKTVPEGRGHDARHHFCFAARANHFTSGPGIGHGKCSFGVSSCFRLARFFSFAAEFSAQFGGRA
jgi:hypothetical protein